MQKSLKRILKKLFSSSSKLLFYHCLKELKMQWRSRAMTSSTPCFLFQRWPSNSLFSTKIPKSFSQTSNHSSNNSIRCTLTRRYLSRREKCRTCRQPLWSQWCLLWESLSYRLIWCIRKPVSSFGTQLLTQSILKNSATTLNRNIYSLRIRTWANVSLWVTLLSSSTACQLFISTTLKSKPRIST